MAPFPRLLLNALTFVLCGAGSRSRHSAGFAASRASPGAVCNYAPFLDEALRRITARLGPLEDYEIPPELREAKTADGKTSTKTVAFSSGDRLRHIRAALVGPADPAEPGARVLNFVCFPNPDYDLPVFGADLVTLPGGHLILIDLHPMVPAAEHSRVVLPAIAPIHARYQGSESSSLPWGGELPEKAKPFFSPAVLWTRLPADSTGTAKLESEVCSGALFDYLDVFLDLVASAEPRLPSDDRAEAQRRYSRYRIENDPARGMLTRMHGEEWTERLINEVLFDFGA